MKQIRVKQSVCKLILPAVRPRRYSISRPCFVVCFDHKEKRLLRRKRREHTTRADHAWLESNARKRCLSLLAALAVLSICSPGCGTTREYRATEQLILSDAVDSSVAQLDFRPLTGRKVYLDTSYLRNVKGEGFVNSDYVTSALRQQVVAAGCLIQDAATEADVIIEARIGTLGADDHRVTFGLPENNAVSAAVSLIPGAPAISSIPEIALARREAREAAVKVSAFAYDRNTREPVWQSGVDRAVATAKDTWVLGVGPFQSGSIRDSTKLAGSKFRIGHPSSTGSPARFFDRPPVDYTAEIRYQQGWPVFDDGGLSADMIGMPETNPEKAQIAETEEDPESQDATLAENPQPESTEDSKNLQR